MKSGYYTIISGILEAEQKHHPLSIRFAWLVLESTPPHKIPAINKYFLCCTRHL